MNSLAILWAQYGPYHFARVEALRRHADGVKVHAFEMANRTDDYAWQREGDDNHLVTLCPNSVYEELPFRKVFLATRRELARRKVDVCLLPSYAPKQSLAALLAAKSLGIRTVMMNESHAGTSNSGKVGTWVKRQLVGLFGAALVGGQPQKRYFTSLGLAENRICLGYDAINNDYFTSRAGAAKHHAAELRAQYCLPEHYFLSLGRFVAKKNLPTLIRAYRKFLDFGPRKQTHLVMVGSGEEEPNVRRLCTELRLPQYDHPAGQPDKTNGAAESPGVHFYGFRQIEENPTFYALADAFILPSLYEEWGLVVNEAMACGLPVVVSRTAGCAEDLLEPRHPREITKTEVAESIRQLGLQLLVQRNGFVFDPRSADELSRSLCCLEANPEMRQAMGLNSRRIIDKFSCQNFAHNALRAARLALQ